MKARAPENMMEKFESVFKESFGDAPTLYPRWSACWAAEICAQIAERAQSASHAAQLIREIFEDFHAK